VILDGLEYPAVVGAQSVAVPLDHRHRPHERLCAARRAKAQSSSDQDDSFSAPRTMAGSRAGASKPGHVYAGWCGLRVSGRLFVIPDDHLLLGPKMITCDYGRSYMVNSW
jgi:hypothetical protein